MGKKYRSSDRTHVTPTRWTKKERSEWDGESRDEAARAIRYIDAGNCENAAAIIFHLERLAAGGITTGAHNDARRDFLSRCLVKKR